MIPLLGKPMVLWVAELSAEAVGAQNVYVATEDQRIADTVEDAGFNAVLTSDGHLTGTDRLAEAAQKVDADIYINVQGDEPLVFPPDIVRVRDEKLAHMGEIVNGFSWVGENEDPHSLNIPKVISTEDDKMIYMSRVALPAHKDSKNAPERYKKQVCIYAFTRDELTAFRAFGRKSELEQSEDIEILRFLELDKSVRLVETRPGSLAVDVPEDVAKVEAALQAAGKA